MPAYRVRYEIDTEADSPQHAAGDALRVMTEPDEEPISYVFDVKNYETGEAVRVHLNYQTRACAVEPMEWDPEEAVVCSLCGRDVPAKTAHLRQAVWIGDECCWDEKLRSSK